MQDLRVLYSTKPPVRCVHIVFPHERNQSSIRSPTFALIQVVDDRIIESQEQRVVAKAVNLPPNEDPYRSSRAGILLKDVDNTGRILLQVKIIISVWNDRRFFAMGNPHAVRYNDDHQAFASADRASNHILTMAQSY